MILAHSPDSNVQLFYTNKMPYVTDVLRLHVTMLANNVALIYMDV